MVPAAAATSVDGFSDDERSLVRQALQYPRGRYVADRTAQLSGVPRSTIYDWAREEILVPDFAQARPMHWSYRDLVFLRLLAWLRTLKMPREEASSRVRHVRALLEREEGDEATAVRSDGQVVLLGRESYDRLTGAQVFGETLSCIATIDLLIPIDVEELGRGRWWAPNLVRPSRRTFISPWVLAGEPCIAETRIATSTLLALHRDRSLSPSAIVDLYPELDEGSVEEAVELEDRLRRAA